MADTRKETCPVCQRKIRLTRAGRIWNHGDGNFPPGQCDGKGQMSVERAELLARAERNMRQGREQRT